MSQFGFAGPLGTVSMTSGQSLSAGFDLLKPWTKVGVHIPSMPSGSDVYIQGAHEDVAASYKRVFHAPTLASATPTGIFVTSGVSNCIVTLPPLPCRFIRIQLSTATTDTPYTFRVFGAD